MSGVISLTVAIETIKTIVTRNLKQNKRMRKSVMIKR